MKTGLRIGLVGEQRQTVERDHLIHFMGSEVAGVLATSWLVWFMEHAARNAILPYMDDGEDSVGTDMQIQHTAPTPQGLEVVCTARVVRIDGRTITFTIDARDTREAIGKALHKRAVVLKSRFARHIARKMGAE
jgi:predicted thioesterase